MLHPLYFAVGSRVRLPEAADHLGLRVDEFEVAGCFAGGMGVCLHLCHRDTGQEFGLKSPRPEFVANELALARFLEELRVWLAASASSGVVEALAVFRLNHMPVVISRWLKGGDWTNTMATMSAQSCWVNLLRVARTLDWAVASLGVAHRDLKPANILLDEEGLAYVSDWGLAKPIETTLQELGTGSIVKYQRFSASHQTQHGTFVGTVLYAAPEQIMGSGSVDHRADIYSLGCIMYELETGSPPFLGTDAMDIAKKHLSQPVPSIGGSAGSARLGIPEIIFRCLAKDPAFRFQAHSDLADALESTAKQRQIELGSTAISMRYKSSLLRHPGAYLRESEQSSPQVGWASAEEDITAALGEADNLMGLGRVEDARAILERFYIADAGSAEAWEMMHAIGCNLAYCLSQLEDDQEQALRIFDQLSPLRDKPPNFYINFALALLRAKRPAEALQVCRRGVRYFPHDPDLLGNFSIALLKTGEDSEAAEVCLRRLAIRRDIHSLEESAVTLCRIAANLKWKDLPTAATYGRLAIELATEGIALNPKFPSLFFARGNAYRFFNRTDLASADYKTAIEIPWHHTMREIALQRLVETLEKEKLCESALSLIDKWSSHVLSDEIRQDIEAVKMRMLFAQLLADTGQNDHYAAGKEIIDFFRSATTEAGTPKYPDEQARVEDWIGRRGEAVQILNTALTETPEHLEVMETLIRVLIGETDYQAAAVWAKRLIEAAPYKAEGHDLAAEIANRTGNRRAADQFRVEAERLFALEQQLLQF